MMLILALSLGVVGGLLLRGRRRLLKSVELTSSATILLLLFLLGLSVGGNATIMSALRHLGFQALTLSLGSVMGSVAISVLLYRHFFRPEANDEE